jgi:endonuclease III
MPPPSRIRTNPPCVPQISAILTGLHGTTPLYNVRNPLWELLYIVCSSLTQETNYLATFRALRRVFPTLDALASADEDAIQQTIARGGLSRRKARGIRAIMDGVTAEFGRPSLAPLARLDDSECEAFLTSLPLVGRKTARCVMLFSLGRAVFPVDTHCWRISQRLGWAPSTRSAPSNRDMDDLQASIPAELRGQLHVALIGFGRHTCRAVRPRCAGCPIREDCPSERVA